VVELPDELMLKQIRAHYTGFRGRSSSFRRARVGVGGDDPLPVENGLEREGTPRHLRGEGRGAVREGFADIPDAAVVMDALVLWRDWLDRRVEMTAARQLARRVITLARTLNERVLTGEALSAGRVLPRSSGLERVPVAPGSGGARR